MFGVSSLVVRMASSSVYRGHVKMAPPCTQYCTVWGTESAQRKIVPQKRSDLWKQKRVVVKLGSAVITREDECGLALGRLASVVEQVAALQKQKKEMIIVTSGAVAFGKQLLRQESLMSMSLRQNLSQRHSDKSTFYLEPRACAAVGQNGLMSMYDSMFQQYGFRTAQVLVNKKDFENEFSCRNLSSTLSHLCNFNTIPIINTNDAIAPPPDQDKDLVGVFSIKDNDSLAARLAVEMGAGLLILMSDVDGLYTAPPGSPDARLLSTFCPDFADSVIIGDKSRVGLGGMDSKVKAATWALNNGTSVVICNGCEENAIINIVKGKKVGTFFTLAPPTGMSIEVLARQAHEGGLKLQTLTAEERSAIINRLADLIQDHKAAIFSANYNDLAEARDRGLSQAVMSSLELSEEHLDELCARLRHMAQQFSRVQGQVIKTSKLADNTERRQITTPLGVVLVVTEGHADALPQMAALAVCSGNGLLLRGGWEASHTNNIFHKLVQQALEPYTPTHAIGLVSHLEDVSDVLQMQRSINLVVPLGSQALLQKVQDNSGHIPVLGKKEGSCHVYVDEDIDPEMALRVVVDSTCQCPGTSNTMETLLIHQKHRRGALFDQIFEELRKKNVHFKPGLQLSKSIHFGRKSSTLPKPEHASLQCTIEVVENVDEAIQHINTHSSGDTETIVTNNGGTAEKFLQLVNSAHVFHNTSTRLSENMGIEVGTNTSHVHVRGPVDVQSLLTTKWVIQGKGQTMQDLVSGQLHSSNSASYTEETNHLANIKTRSSKAAGN